MEMARKRFELLQLRQHISYGHSNVLLQSPNIPVRADNARNGSRKFRKSEVINIFGLLLFHGEEQTRPKTLTRESPY